MWPKIKISGFSDEIDSSLSKQIEVLHKLGIGYIEMRGVNGRNLVDHTLTEAEDILSELKNNSIALSSVGSPIGKISILDDFEPHYDLFRHTVDLAKLLETRYIRIFSFFIPREKDPAVYRDEVFRRTARLVEYAAANEITLLHENEKEIYGDTAPRCLDLMKEFYGPHYKAVFDFANFVQVGQDTNEAYEMLRPYISYIHVKDAVMADGHVTPAGLGDGHVKEILQELKESGYHGFLSIEPHLQTFDGLALLEHRPSASPRLMTGEECYTLAYQHLMKILREI